MKAQSLLGRTRGPILVNQGTHAVVIGGSVAGLLAGRVLADHFDRVTIVERDRYAHGPEARKGVPQARHAHILLTRGQQILEQLFPGLGNQLVEAGAPFLDAVEDVAWLTPAGWPTRFRSGLSLWSASRNLLDWTIRRRVAAIPNVRFLQEIEVTGLLTSAAGNRVAGISVRRRGQAADGGLSHNRLDADLVVDASGRGSRAPQWLQALGYAPPEETVVNAFLGYASRVYGCPSRSQSDWKAVYLQSKPPAGTRSGVILPIEGNRWMVTLAGRGGDYPPTDEVGFLDYARSLPSPVLHNAIRDAEALSPISGHRGTENRWRRYERLSRWLEGFMVVGDAACAFNPVYGQGMTNAALGAMTLDACLRQQGRYGPAGHWGGLARRFQRRLAKVNARSWLLATTEDNRYPTTVGCPPNWAARLQQRYVDQVMRLGMENTEAGLRFLEVIHMLKPPLALFSPSILWLLLKQALRSILPWQMSTWPEDAREPVTFPRIAAHFGHSTATIG